MISVVIPCYNYGCFLQETLMSVKSQTYSDWECIIVNDGSTDNTEEIAIQFTKEDNRFHYLKRENGGLSAARNTGLSIAKGDYIQFLDADDLIHPEKFEHQLDIFADSPELDICYSNFEFFDSPSGNILNKTHFAKQVSINPIEDVLFKFGKDGFIIPIHCALIKRGVWENSNVFNESLKAREDWLMWLDLALRGKTFLFIDKPFALYRKHSESMVHNQSNMAYYIAYSSMLALDLIPNKYKEKFIAHVSNQFSEIIKDKEYEKYKITSSRSYRFYKKLIVTPYGLIKKLLKKL